MASNEKIIAQTQEVQQEKVKKAKKIEAPDQKRFRMWVLAIMGIVTVLGLILSILSYKGLI